MDDSATYKGNKTDTRSPFGMDSFGEKERQQFGQNIRLAMGCIEGTTEPVKGKAMPSDVIAIRQRLKVLSQEITSHHADLLELLVRFDELEGWKAGGTNHCAAWMNLEIGIGLKLAWEYLRVGRELRELPTTTALFRAGKLTWCKVRAITAVADKENEKTLCHAAFDASVTDVQKLCKAYKWKKDKKDDSEDERALRQWESRALYWDDTSIGSTQIRLILPPELAQAFLNSVEHSLKQLDDSDSKMSQRRADAAVLMAESSLQSASREVATADRYQVIVSVEASELATSHNSTTNSEASEASSPTDISDIPSKRPTINNAGPIARETARRIACDCSISVYKTLNGEPINIGRRSRIWPAAMERAIKDRDQHCQFPGCSQTKYLNIHHIEHWADGGETSVENGVCVCQYHHALLHEGGYSIQRIDSDEQLLNEQFERQKNANDLSQFNVEINLRNDRDSFDTVRKLSPTRYRFRVVDSAGQDIRDMQHASGNKNQTPPTSDHRDSTHVDCCNNWHKIYDATPMDYDSTCVSCAEPV